MAPLEALYEWPCRSPICWLGSRNVVIVGPHLLQKEVKMINFIWQKIKTTQDWQESYPEVRMKEIEFNVRGSVYLKVPPIKCTISFSFSKKFKCRYIGPFNMIVTVRNLTYKLVLPPNMYKVQIVFRISMLKKYIRDESHIIPNYRKLNIQRDATYKEEPTKFWTSKIKS